MASGIVSHSLWLGASQRLTLARRLHSQTARSPFRSEESRPEQGQVV